MHYKLHSKYHQTPILPKNHNQHLSHLSKSIFHPLLHLFHPYQYKIPISKKNNVSQPSKIHPQKNNSNLPSDWSKLPISQSFQPSLYFPKNNSLNDLYSLYLLNHFHSPIEMSAKRTLIYSIISRGYSISQISTNFQFLVMLSYVRKPPEPWTTSPLVTLLRSPWAFFPSSPLLASTLSTMMSMFFVESSLCVNSFCSLSSSHLSIPFSSKFDFHVLNDNGISYIALSDRDLPLRIAFVSHCCARPHLSLELPRRNYAEFRQHLWVLDFAVFPSIPSDRVKTSQAYSMSDFASTLHKIMVRFLSPIRCD